MTERAFEELRELRARYPELIVARAAERKRRPLLGSDGRLMIAIASAGSPTRWRTATTCSGAC
jgi:hypothetical protein